MTEMEKLGGIFVSPVRTFDAINSRPTWLLPFILLILASLAINFVAFKIIVSDANIDPVARELTQWEASETGQSVSPTVLQTQIAALHSQRERWYVQPVISTVISAVALSAVFFVVLWLARADTSLVKVFAVTIWSFIIYRVLGGAVTIVALLVHGPANFHPAPAEAWSPTSLANLVSRTAVAANTYSAISKIDVFLVWCLVVIAIGFSRTSKNLSMQKSFAIILSLEAVYLSLNAVGALPGAA